MRTITFLVTVATVLSLCSSGTGQAIEPVNPNPSAEARQVFDYLESTWIYVDLGDTYRVDRVNLLWGWKIHAADFAIDVAVKAPDASDSWSEVFSVKDRPYQTWEATDRVRFEPTAARYVRLRAMKRAGNQNWSGYKLAALEIPVPREVAK